MMEPLICTYCEGTDVKVAVIVKEKEQIKLLRTADFDIFHSKAVQADAVASMNLEAGDISLLEVDKSPDGSVSNESLLNSALSNIKLTSCEFVPAITEPAIHYHVYEGIKETNPTKLQDAILKKFKIKKCYCARDNLGYTELAAVLAFNIC